MLFEEALAVERLRLNTCSEQDAIARGLLSTLFQERLISTLFQPCVNLVFKDLFQPCFKKALFQSSFNLFLSFLKKDLF
jgi:hypothetical protein